MFFRKKKVDYDDDYDDDNWDDLDDLSDEGGFNDNSPKGGVRKAIGTLTGSFIGGVKSGAMNAETHKRIIKRSLPEGFVSHYDDILSVKRETQSIYDTVSKDVKKTHDEYRKELKPHINEYHRNKGGKVSGALEKWANRARDESGPSGPSHDELAFLSASEAVFGGGAQNGIGVVQAEQSIDQAEDDATANKISAAQGAQTNALLTHVGNQMNRQTAFNEQVAMRWKRKTLELQFKQFFVARKNLDVNEQTQGLLKSSLEAIVKNTGLPDAAKIQLGEAAGQLFRDKFLGSLHDKGISKFADLAGGVSKKLTGRIGESLEAARGQSGMINMVAGLVNKGGDGDYGQSPMELALSMIGGAAGNSASGWLGDKIGKVAKNRVDASGVDTGLLDAKLDFAKANAVNVGKGMLQTGTGIGWLDNALKWFGAEDVITSRSNVLQSSMEDNLRDQALFDLETKKSITYSIPMLLGEIHAEVSHFRKLTHPESKDPKRDDKLRMDWKTGKLNTTGNIVKDMKQRINTPARLKETEDATRELFEKLGFKKERFDKDGNLTAETGDDILLASADISELSKALRKASYDPNAIFDAVDLAAARTGLFNNNKQAELRIAEFFTQQFEMDTNQQSLSRSTDHINDFNDRIESSTEKSLRAQSGVTRGLNLIRERDTAAPLYEKFARTNMDLLGEEGLVGLDNSNNYVYDVEADAEALANQKGKRYNARELQRGDFKDPYNVHYRAELAQKAQAEKAERSKKNKEEQDEKLAAEIKRLLEVGSEKKNGARSSLLRLLGMEDRDPNYNLNRYNNLKSTDTTFSLDTGERKSSIYGPDSRWANSQTPEQINANKDKIGAKIEGFLDAMVNKTVSAYKDITAELEKDSSYIEAVKTLYGEEWQDKQKEALKSYYDHIRENTDKFTSEQLERIKKLDKDVIKEFTLAEAEKAKQKLADIKAAAVNAEVQEANPADTIRGRTSTAINNAKIRATAAINQATLVPESDDTPEPTVVSTRRDGSPRLTPEERARKFEAAPPGYRPKHMGELTIIGSGAPDNNRMGDRKAALMDFENQEFIKAWGDGKYSPTAKQLADEAAMPTVDELNALLAAAGILPSDIENRYMGGMIGTYSAGGRITRRNPHALKELAAKTKDRTNSLANNLNRTNTLVQKLADAYRIEKENNGGEEPIIVVASEDEYVVPKTNNQSYIMQQMNESGFWSELVDQINNGTLSPSGERITAETSAFNPSNDDIFVAREPHVPKSNASQVDTSSSKLSEWVNVTRTGFDSLGKQLGAFTNALVQTPEGEVVPDTRVGKLKAIGERTAVAAKAGAIDASTSIKGQAVAAMARGKDVSTTVTEDGVQMPEGYELTPANDPNISIGKFRKVVKLERNEKGVLVAHYSYVNAAIGEPMENKDETPAEVKKRGLLFRAITWGPKQAYKNTLGRDFRRSKAGKGKAIDVYLIGDPEPVLTVRDMKKGLYLDQKTGTPIKTLSDIKGPVVDVEGNIIISAEDLKEKRLVTREGAPVKGLLTTVAGGLFGLAGATIGGSFGLAGKAVGAQVGVAKVIFGPGRKKVNKRTANDFITQDVYVKGENKPRIKSKDVKNEEYINSEGKIVVRYGDLKGTVYDSEANIVLDIEDYEKGLVFPDGSTIGKVVGAGFGALGSITSNVFKAAGISAGILPMLASGGLKLAGAAFKGTGKFFGLLTGNGGGMSNSKYTMMLQTQAAAVDKLEMIRLIMDERMKKPDESKFNDKDKDGYRDGSWYSNMMKKKDKKADKEAKKEAKKDKDGNEKEPGFLSKMLSAAMGFITGAPVIAMAGGALIGAVAPFLMKAIGHGIKNILPTWLGGYKNDEERAAGKAKIFSKAPEPGLPGSGEPGAPAGPDTVDAEGNVIPGAPAGPPLDEPMSLGKRMALGAGGALALRYGAGAAIKGTAKGAWGATKWVGRKVVKPVAKAAGRFALKQVGRIAATHMAGTVVTALASNPIGWGIAAVVGVGLAVYGGYKLYKYLKSRKDNHLTEFRMNQYGYEIGNKDAVTKILDLEDYLKAFTTPGSKTSGATITGGAQATEAHRIFGIKSDDKADVARFDAWFFGRFKPIYLSWRTAITRTVGKVELSKIDEMSFKADKLTMLQSAHYSSNANSPYNVMTSPLAESESVELDADDVYSEYKKILVSLKEINAEEHDEKVKSKGGGPKNLDKLRKTEKVKSVTDKPVTGTGSDNSDKSLNKDKAKSQVNEEQTSNASKNKYLFGNGDKPAGFVQAANNWADKVVGGVKSWFGGGAGGPSGEFDASSKTLNLTEQDIMDIAKVTTTEVAMSLSETERKRQAAAVIDTILNRTVTGKWGNNVRGVINAKRQFSKIAGPPSTKPYGSVQNMPTSAMNAEIAAFTREYLAKRAAGQKSIVDGNLSYANPNYITPNNRAWVTAITQQAAATGQRFGSGANAHVHGTTQDMMNIRPTGYKINLSGGSSAPATPAAASVATSDKLTTNTPKAAPKSPAVTSTSGTPKAKSGGGILGFAAKDISPKAKATPKNTALKAGGGVLASNKTYLDGKGPAVGLRNAQKVAAVVDGRPDKTAIGAENEQAKGPMKTLNEASQPVIAARHARKHARGESIGLCATYVRKALQVAGYKFTPQASAYMYVSNGQMVNMGFTQINGGSQWQVGDVIVMDKLLPKRPHGHIAIWDGRNWVSDFVQQSFTPYSTHRPPYQLFRDSNYLNGATKGSGWTASVESNLGGASFSNSNALVVGDGGGTGAYGQLLSFKLPDLGITAKTKEERDAARKNDYKEGGRKAAALKKIGGITQYGSSTNTQSSGGKSISENIRLGKLDTDGKLGKLSNVPFDIKDTNPYKAKDGVIDESRYDKPFLHDTSKGSTSQELGDVPGSRNTDRNVTNPAGPIAEVEAMKADAQEQLSKYSGDEKTPDWIKESMGQMVNGVQVLTDLSTQTIRRRSDGKILIRRPDGKVELVKETDAILKDAKDEVKAEVGSGIGKPTATTEPSAPPIDSKGDKDTKVQELLRKQKEKEVTAMKEDEARQTERIRAETNRTTILNESLIVQRSMDVSLRDIAATLKSMGAMGARDASASAVPAIEAASNESAPVTFGAHTRMRTVNAEEPVSMRIN